MMRLRYAALASMALATMAQAQALPRDTFTMVTGNVALPPVAVYGGNYLFAQTCTGYGTVTLSVQGPGPGAAYQVAITKTVSDTGATPVQLGSYARVVATISGTTGCEVTLSRVPM